MGKFDPSLPRYPNGRAVPAANRHIYKYGGKRKPGGMYTPEQMEEALRTGVYPDPDDIRNTPEARADREHWRKKGPLVLPKGMAPVWTGSRKRCDSCGHLHPA